MYSIRRLSSIGLKRPFRILGIETSCDDTAAAVVDSEKNILSQACRNQLKFHQPWGGVVPSIAKNQHYENLVPVIAEVMENIDWDVSAVSYILIQADAASLLFKTVLTCLSSTSFMIESDKYIYVV